MLENSLKEVHERLKLATGFPDLPYAINFNDLNGQPESWRTEPTWEADHPRGDGIDGYLAKYCAPDQKYIILDDSTDFHAHQKTVFCQIKSAIRFLDCRTMLRQQN